MTGLPDPEIELFIDTGVKAVELATARQFAEGHEELVNGLRRAEVLERDGEPWAPDLVRRYQHAVDAYCETYLVPME